MSDKSSQGLNITEKKKINYFERHWRTALASEFSFSIGGKNDWNHHYGTFDENYQLGGHDL